MSIPPYYRDEAVAVGYGGSILRTGNGGASWAARPSPARQVLYRVSCPAGTGVDCVAVGSHGTTVRTAP